MQYGDGAWFRRAWSGPLTLTLGMTQDIITVGILFGGSSCMAVDPYGYDITIGSWTGFLPASESYWAHRVYQIAGTAGQISIVSTDPNHTCVDLGWFDVVTPSLPTIQGDTARYDFSDSHWTTGEPQQYDNWLWNGGGSWFRRAWSGPLTLTLGTTQNITAVSILFGSSTCVALDPYNLDITVGPWTTSVPASQSYWAHLTYSISETADEITTASTDPNNTCVDLFWVEVTQRNDDASSGEECGAAATEGCVAANTNQQTQPTVGSPINPRTGNYVYGVTDLTVRGRSESLSFRRIYSAYRLRWADNVLGPGWTHNYNLRLILSSDPEGEVGRVVFQEANGSRQRFVDHGDGTYTPESGLLAQLQRSGAPGSYVYTMTLTNQLRYQFDNAGRLAQIDHLSGTGTWNPVILTYDGNGRLSRVADGSRYLEFGYDANGRIATVYDHRRATDPNSPAVTYTYDAAGNLTGMADLRGQTWTYQYTDALHPHHLTAVLDPLGHVVERQTYDTEGRVTEQRDGQDAIVVSLDYLDDQRVVVADGRGNAQTYTYSSRGTFTGVELSYGGQSISTSLGHDQNYRPNQREDANGNPTTYTWSADGNTLNGVTDALGRTTGYAYGSYNNLTQVTDAQGNLTRYEYNDSRFPTLPTALVDDFNNRTMFTYTAEGYLETVTDAHNVVTRHSYDSYGQRTQTVVNYVNGVYDPNAPDEDLATTFVYDAIGRLTEIVDAQGRRQRVEYDAAGNVTRLIRNYVNGVYDPNVPDQDIVTTTVYDAAGRPISVTDTLGRVTVFEYDNANRPTRVVRNYQDGVYSASTPDQDVSTSYAYDAAGNQTRVIDVLGRTNWTCYDSLNRPVRQVQNATGDGQTPQTNPCDAANYVPSSAVDEDIITSTVYDANGNVVDGYDAAGVRTHYLYDALNRQVAAIVNFQDGIHVFDPADPAYDPPDRDVIALTYYGAVGNVEHTVDPAGHVTWLCYDDLNRRIRTVENASQADPDPNSPANPCHVGYQPSAAADADLITTTVYDALGRVQETVDSLGRRTRLVYDDAGRVVQRIANYQDGVYDPNAPDVDVSSQTVYDGLGRVFETIDALGRHTRPVYDNLDRQVATIRNYQDGVYDPNTPDVDVRAATTYDGLGRVVGQTNPNTLTTTFIYDGLDRLVQVTDPLSQASHTVYDGAGNVVAATDPLGHATTFAYDGLDRQAAVTSQLQHTATTTYDRLGRVIDRVDAEGLRATFGYDMLGRLTSVIENATGAPIVNDPASPDVNVQTLYTYDVLGNLRTITLPGGAVITHTYDALGRRTATDGSLPGTVDLWTTTYDRGGREV